MPMPYLPKEIRDYIAEYNVDHRPQMSLVMEELLVKQKDFIEKYYSCNYCGDSLDYDENTEDERGLYSSFIYSNKYYFCSSYCLLNNEYLLRKRH